MCTPYNCCVRFFVWIYTTFWNWAWNYITTTWTSCTKQKCNWWCLCCNQWLCFVFLVFLAILVIVAVIVLTLLAVLWCIICFIFCLVTGGFFGGNPSSKPKSSKPSSQGSNPFSGPHVGSQPPTGQMVGRRLRISDLRQLEQLSELRRLLLNMTPVELDLPGLVRDEVEGWQASLNRSIIACGCQEGAIGMGLFLAAYGVYSLVHPMGPMTALRHVELAAAVALTGAVAGKATGLIREKARLRQTLRDLRETLARRVPAA